MTMAKDMNAHDTFTASLCPLTSYNEKSSTDAIDTIDRISDSMVTRNLKYTLNDAVSCRHASTKGSSALVLIFLASAWSALSFLHMSSTPIPNLSRGTLESESLEASNDGVTLSVEVAMMSVVRARVSLDWRCRTSIVGFQGESLAMHRFCTRK